jgi:uncharacterized repeat protein (TIGR01451 family)
MAGTSSAASGTVTYNLYEIEDCSGDPVGTWTGAVAYGVAESSGPFQVTLPSTFNWLAVYTGDDRNEAAASDCGTETLVVLAPDLNLEKFADTRLVSAGEAIAFTVTVSNTGDGDAFERAATYDLPAGIVWSEVDGAAGVDVPADCEPGDAQFQVDDLAPFFVGGDGTETLVLTVGQHTITETCTTTSAQFTVAEGATTEIVVINVQGSDCDSNVPTLPNTAAGTGAVQRQHNAVLSALLAAWSAVFLWGMAWRRRPGVVGRRS